MKDWIERLDDFVKMTGNNILQHAGKVSHQQALEKANEEYRKYKEQTKNDITAVEVHFVKQIEETAKKLSAKRQKNKFQNPPCPPCL